MPTHIEYIDLLRYEASQFGVTITRPEQQRSGLWQSEASYHGGTHFGKPCRTAREAIQNVFNDTIVLGKIIGRTQHVISSN